MISDQGWVKLHRKILDNPVFKYDDTAWKVFTVLLLLANREGYLTTGTRQLGDWIDKNQSVALRALKRLEKCEMVHLTAHRRFTGVQICKWDEYQQTGASTNASQTHRRRIADAYTTRIENKNKEIVSTDNHPADDVPEKKEIALSPAVRELWEYWESQMAPITQNQIFHRNVLSTLLKQHGCDTVKKMIRVAAAAHVEKYVSKNLKISSPKQLQQQWDALYLWAKSKMTNQPSHFTTK